MNTVQNVTLIGYGAIAQSIVAKLASHARLCITHVVVHHEKIPQTQADLQTVTRGCTAVSQVPPDATLVVECAGHSALREHVLPALARGIPCAVVSIGALAEMGLVEALSHAALQGNTQVHLLSGAIGAIDALASAKLAGLTSVTYTGRKPPMGWTGTPAENVCDLTKLQEAAVILQATAREAASLYPKNANVAATVSLAGLGLDATQVRLIADPAVTENIHTVEAVGAFGSFKLEMRGNPLPENPKTSMLTVLSALRFLENRVNALTL
jgi:aspartate dehydrogenase